MKGKRLPRLWCALQGLLPFDACVAAQAGELAWPESEPLPVEKATPVRKRPSRRSRSPKKQP